MKLTLAQPSQKPGIVIVLGDALEAELLVVERAGELDRVERAALQRRIDVAAADAVCGTTPSRAMMRPPSPAMRNFRPLQVLERS